MAIQPAIAVPLSGPFVLWDHLTDVLRGSRRISPESEHDNYEDEVYTAVG